MTMLTTAAVFFLAIHLLVAGTTLRDAAVHAVGERSYLGMFSLASVAGIVWLALSYNAASAEGSAVWWDFGAGVKHLGPLIVGVAFLLGVSGLLTPGPTAAGMESRAADPATVRGVLRITRHPFLWGVALWSAFHLAANGDAASVVFFGTFLVLSVAGTYSIDAKRARKMGTDWQGFLARTSNFPFAAIFGGAAMAVIDLALTNIGRIKNHPQPGEPTVLGAHLEGPFINPGKLGAQSNQTLEGDANLALRWHDLCPLILATVAPEILGGGAVIEALTARGCRVQIGHSLATVEETATGFGRGLAGFTHLFNGMSGLDHRSPGVAAYALAHGCYAELICDLIHVHPEMIRAAVRAIPRLYAISDATALAGCPDGEHGIGSDGHVIKTGNMIMLANGKSLAGSAITMLDAFRNLISLGFSIAVASDMCSTRQAEYLGRSDIGRIAPGALASFVILTQQCELSSVWVMGRQIGETSDQSGLMLQL